MVFRRLSQKENVFQISLLKLSTYCEHILTFHLLLLPLPIILNPRPSKQQNHAHNPSRPPNTPNHNLRIHTPNIPPIRRLRQHLSNTQSPILRANQDHRGRRHNGQWDRQNAGYEWVFGERFDVGEGSGEEAYEEGEREVKGCERGEEHAKEKEGERFYEVVLLGCRGEVVD